MRVILSPNDTGRGGGAAKPGGGGQRGGGGSQELTAKRAK